MVNCVFVCCYCNCIGRSNSIGGRGGFPKKNFNWRGGEIEGSIYEIRGGETSLEKGAGFFVFST